MASTHHQCTLLFPPLHHKPSFPLQFHRKPIFINPSSRSAPGVIHCSIELINNSSINGKPTLKTCKNCKNQFDPSANHRSACRFHTAHFGGETKSVYTGGTKNTPESGRVFQFWHCCGSLDPLDPGCATAPHSSYDD